MVSASNISSNIQVMPKAVILSNAIIRATTGNDLAVLALVFNTLFVSVQTSEMQN